MDLLKNNIETLPESIGRLKVLKVLDISWNNITTIPESVKRLEKKGLKIHQGTLDTSLI